MCVNEFYNMSNQFARLVYMFGANNVGFLFFLLLYIRKKKVVNWNCSISSCTYSNKQQNNIVWNFWFMWFVLYTYNFMTFGWWEKNDCCKEMLILYEKPFITDTYYLYIHTQECNTKKKNVNIACGKKRQILVWPKRFKEQFLYFHNNINHSSFCAYGCHVSC